MKVGIIGFLERNMMPFAENYISVLEKHDIEYGCIFWNRNKDSKLEKVGNNYILNMVCRPGNSKLSKIVPMLRFKYAVEKIIQNEKYTHLVILTTQPAVLLNNVLRHKYKNKFIFDYRDYSYERFGFYRKIVNKLIEVSYFTAISSKGFLKYLDNNIKIFPCHNISIDFPNLKNANGLKQKDVIKIGFVGGVRYFKENTKLIDNFANNNKYILKYIGQPNIDCNLEDYCCHKAINNVYFQGRFENKQKPKIYEDIDIINSIYGNNSLEVTTALPNRLYDALLFKKPIIVSKGTYLSAVVDKYKIGVVVDVVNDDLVNKLEKYICDFKIDDFNKNVDSLLKIITNEQKIYFQKIEEFVLRG